MIEGFIVFLITCMSFPVFHVLSWKNWPHFHVRWYLIFNYPDSFLILRMMHWRKIERKKKYHCDVLDVFFYLNFINYCNYYFQWIANDFQRWVDVTLTVWPFLSNFLERKKKLGQGVVDFKSSTSLQFYYYSIFHLSRNFPESFFVFFFKFIFRKSWFLIFSI